MHTKNINRQLLQLVFEGLTHDTKKPTNSSKSQEMQANISLFTST